MSMLFKKTKELTAQIDDFLDAISEGALVFQQGVADYLSGDLEAFQRRYRAIEALENRADDLRRTIEGHLYRHSLIPESRGDVLGFLENTDRIIGTAKRVLQRFEIERPEVAPDQNDLFLELTECSVQAIDRCCIALGQRSVKLGTVVDRIV